MSSMIPLMTDDELKDNNEPWPSSGSRSKPKFTLLKSRKAMGLAAFCVALFLLFIGWMSGGTASIDLLPSAVVKGKPTDHFRGGTYWPIKPSVNQTRQLTRRHEICHHMDR